MRCLTGTIRLTATCMHAAMAAEPDQAIADTAIRDAITDSLIRAATVFSGDVVVRVEARHLVRNS
ncbi:MAG: hypothetical protein ACOCXJ_08990 [Planctomycetota bacterium]